MCTGEIPTTDNIPEKTEKLGCPTDNLHLFLFQIDMIKLSVLKNRLSGILSVVGIPPVPIPEEIQLLMYGKWLYKDCKTHSKGILTYAVYCADYEGDWKT